MKPDIKVIIAAHKPYWVPDDPMYVPVQVGAAGKETIPGFQRDDEGDNISSKNPRYCELTALYWAWKNLDTDYVGLVHYRRHFAGKGEKGILTCAEASQLVQKSPVLLPKKRHYLIETVGSHYCHTFDGNHLDCTRQVLSRCDPQLVRYFDKHLDDRSAHIWNMMLMRRDVLDEWCSFLFPVLFEIESHLDFSNMTPFEERVIGRISERLLDPWLMQSANAYQEIPTHNLEGENWVKKGSSFLAAKFMGRSYRESF